MVCARCGLASPFQARDMSTVQCVCGSTWWMTPDEWQLWIDKGPEEGSNLLDTVFVVVLIICALVLAFGVYFIGHFLLSSETGMERIFSPLVGYGVLLGSAPTRRPSRIKPNGRSAMRIALERASGIVLALVSLAIIYATVASQVGGAEISRAMAHSGPSLHFIVRR